MNVLEKILEEIDREIYKQREICNEVLDTPGYRLYERTMKRAKDIVERHIDDVKDTNVPSNDDWIPVEERLPEEKGDITKDFNLFKESLHLITDGVNVTIALFDGGYFRCYDDYVPYTDVTAWQPLPKPYKPKKVTAAGMEHIMSRFTKVE